MNADMTGGSKPVSEAGEGDQGKDDDITVCVSRPSELWFRVEGVSVIHSPDPARRSATAL